MSSFWNIFGKDGKEGGPEGGEGGEQAAASQVIGSKAPPALDAGTSLPEPRPVPALPPQRTTPRYGIDDAIKLMRTLPVDENVDLVVRVIKRTLESLSVRVPDILEDAQKRQESLRSKIAEHHGAIMQLERDIEGRRQEIARLDDELAETTTVRERLQLAEATSLAPTPTPAKVTVSPLSSTGSNKKADVPPSRTAPPLPANATTFRPKLSSESKKPSMPPPPPSRPDTSRPDTEDEEEEQPVESRDLEKL
jgi:hypothetical protein